MELTARLRKARGSLGAQGSRRRRRGSTAARNGGRLDSDNGVDSALLARSERKEESWAMLVSRSEGRGSHGGRHGGVVRRRRRSAVLGQRGRERGEEGEVDRGKGLGR